MQYTKQQKQEYFQNLRKEWKKSKALAENDPTAKALFRETKLLQGISYTSFYFTLSQMRAKNWKGLPYIDCKTFAGWRSNGFKVKKDEKSQIRGIVWKHPIQKNKDENENVTTTEDKTLLYPKAYACSINRKS